MPDFIKKKKNRSGKENNLKERCRETKEKSVLWIISVLGHAPYM